MSNEGRILIEILADSREETYNCQGCPGGSCCGWSDYAATISVVAEVLREQFGELVAVCYIDIGQTGLSGYPKVRNVLALGYRYPITVINGSPRLAGGISPAKIKKLVEETLDQPQVG